jgi:two-component system phosphate regulon response regulator PhoB
VRTVVCRFADAARLRRALSQGDAELEVAEGETLADGEWVLAIVEVKGKRATALAARGILREGERPKLGFEARDWEKLAALTAPSVPPPGAAAEPPEEPSPETDRSPAVPPAAPSTGTLSARILLVDDDPALREVVCAMLEAVGLETEAVASAEEALARIDAGDVDLVVLDWGLPGESGLELCRRLRARPEHARLPVLFLTGRVSSHDMVEAFASGADDYVHKPFRAPELGARIFGLLRRARVSAA